MPEGRVMARILGTILKGFFVIPQIVRKIRMKAIRFAKTGGPEVLALKDIVLPPPAAGQVTIRHTVIGVNFIDTYQRSGLYPRRP